MKVLLQVWIIVGLLCVTPRPASSEHLILQGTDSNHAPELSIDAYKIFTLQHTRWIDGSRISIFTFPFDSPAHTQFVWNVLGMTSFRYKRRIMSTVYSGKGKKPTEVHSFDEMIEKVKHTNNSIGYLDEGVIVNENDNITIITFN